MDENQIETEDENEEGMSGWLQENFRIIVSILIVVAIAGGIYSYSKRTQPSIADLNEGEKIAENLDSLKDQDAESGKVVIENKDAKTGTETKKEVVTDAKPTTPAVTSQETDSSFQETAQRGDGKTHLARRALANYLEKNADSSLTAEHKVYIEDYLRKHVGYAGRVHVGTKIEFSKDLIKQAIEKSKQLNDGQLKNLQKYSARVSSLS